jgi:uncharacterized protein YwqG
MQSLDFAEVLEQPIVWLSIDDIPEEAFRIILEYGKGDDVITPLIKGKEWLLEYLQQYQPKTASVLLNGGELVVAGEARKSLAMQLKDRVIPSTTRYRMSLFLRLGERVVRINRLNANRHPDDLGYGYHIVRHPSDTCYRCVKSLPEELSKAYYSRFNGLALPNSILNDKRLLPRPVPAWDALESYLSGCSKKNRMPWFEERVPGLKHLNRSDAYDNFRYFLSTFDTNMINKKLTDELFVSTHIQDGLIYHIKDEDIENTRLMVAPQEAIDGYCEHMLLNKPGRFDFIPYTEPVNGRWGEIPESELHKFAPPKATTAPVWKGKQAQSRKNIIFNETVSGNVNSVDTRFGGQPDWIGTPQWPLSKSTGKPMRFIGQVRLDDTGLAEDGVATANQIAYLFMSDNNGDYQIGSESAHGGENAVILQPQGQYEGKNLQQATGPSISEFESGPNVCYTVTTTDGKEPEFKKQAQRDKMPLDKLSAYEELLGGNKMGGRPAFKQNDEFPNTNQRWHLVLQLEEKDVPFKLNLGDAGFLYVYVNKNAKRGYMNWQSD